MIWLKKYGIALAALIVIIGVVVWITVGQLSKPDREPAKVEAGSVTVEKSFTVEPEAEKSVEVK